MPSLRLSRLRGAFLRTLSGVGHPEDALRSRLNTRPFSKERLNLTVRSLLNTLKNRQQQVAQIAAPPNPHGGRLTVRGVTSASISASEFAFHREDTFQTYRDAWSGEPSRQTLCWLQVLFVFPSQTQDGCRDVS